MAGGRVRAVRRPSLASTTVLRAFDAPQPALSRFASSSPALMRQAVQIHERRAIALGDARDDGLLCAAALCEAFGQGCSLSGYRGVCCGVPLVVSIRASARTAAMQFAFARKVINVSCALRMSPLQVASVLQALDNNSERHGPARAWRDARDSFTRGSDEPDQRWESRQPSCPVNFRRVEQARAYMMHRVFRARGDRERVARAFRARRTAPSSRSWSTRAWAGSVRTV